MELTEALPGIFYDGDLLSKWIPHEPFPKQIEFLVLGSSCREVFFGGAAGPGKSDALLMAALQYVDLPQYRCLVLRLTYEDLALPGAIMDRFLDWMAGFISAGLVHWNAKSKRATFPSGAVIQFGYYKSPNDWRRYQGAEFHRVIYDEVTQFHLEQYLEPGMTRARRLMGDPIPISTLSASNPGDVGHEWVLERFVDKETAIAPFVPALLKDNPAVDAVEYAKGLMHLHPTRRAQMLEGDWSARDPGDYWRREWVIFDPVGPSPQFSRRIRFWDLAASESETACWTSGVLQAQDRGGCFYIEDQVRGRWTSGTRDGVIVQTAVQDGTRVIVGLEEEPGSGGKAQVESLRTVLEARGFMVWAFNPGAAKLNKMKRAEPIAVAAEAGKYVVVIGDGGRPDPWVKGFMSRMEGFPGTGTAKDKQSRERDLDDMDSVSGGMAYFLEKPWRVFSGGEVVEARERPSVRMAGLRGQGRRLRDLM